MLQDGNTNRCIIETAYTTIADSSQTRLRLSRTGMTGSNKWTTVAKRVILAMKSHEHWVRHGNVHRNDGAGH